MDLLITKDSPSTVWQLVGDKVTQIRFPNYYDHDLVPPGPYFEMHFPWEITSKILLELFKVYLQTYNFDLAIELMSVNKDFVRQMYLSIYGRAPVDEMIKRERLTLTLAMYEAIHDQYISVIRQKQFSIFKMVRRGDPSLKIPVEPWEFCFDCFIEPLSGIVCGPDDPCEVFTVGSCYGDQLWLYGGWRKGVFECSRMSTPVINLKFVDIFDVLKLNCETIKSNKRFSRFFALLKFAYGKHSCINVMVQDGELSPFVSNTRTFYSI